MNLYDPIKIKIDGILTEARVISLSGIPDKKGMDIFGRPLKPELIQTNCPKCKGELRIILPYTLNGIYEHNCPDCIEKIEEIIFFVDPIASNRIRQHELFSTIMTNERINELTEEIDIEERERIFGFEESDEPINLVEKSDLGLSFDDEDLLEE